MKCECCGVFSSQDDLIYSEDDICICPVCNYKIRHSFTKEEMEASELYYKGLNELITNQEKSRR
jgi:hypothetical protein